MSLLIGTQLYGWGQAYGMKGRQISEHYNDVLAAVADMGFDTAEASADPADPDFVAQFADLLRGHGLKPVSMYCGADLHDKARAGQTVEQIIAMGESLAQEGFSALDCNPTPIGREKTDDELVVQAEHLDALGAELRGIGIALGLHNHTPEMVSEGREFHHNLRQTNPENVGLFMDVHWCWRGGADPWEIFTEYQDRLVGLHVRQSVDHIWTEDFCEGDLDYRPYIDALIARQFEGPVLVELAIEEGTPQTRTPEENHRRSAAYLRSLLPA